MFFSKDQKLKTKARRLGTITSRGVAGVRDPGLNAILDAKTDATIWLQDLGFSRHHSVEY